MSAVNTRNVLVLLGIVMSIIGLAYFAIEFFADLSDWGRVLSFLLLGVMYVALGVHFGQSGDPTEVVERSGWRWLRVTNALYILGAICSGGSVIAFFAVDEIPRVVKLAIALGLGLALILYAARRRAPGIADA